MEIRNALTTSLQTGFLDHLIESNKLYRPELLINNREQEKKVLTSILRKLENCDHFWFSVAFITTSGIATLMNTLIELQKKGIKGKILASQYLNFTQPEALKRLLQFQNIELRIATTGDFHSKGYLFKNEEIYDLIIGSSNLTQSALSTNREWNLKVCATLQSELIKNTLKEFEREFKDAEPVTKAFLDYYENIYNTEKQLRLNVKDILETKVKKVTPNSMQEEALKNIELLRSNGKRKALLISATGTGKTYLSAFDVQSFKPKKFLFVVHRKTIANEAMKTFRNLLGPDIKMGLYSGAHQEKDKDYLFSTVQTISKDDHLFKFDSDHFDYIVIDETHRAGATSYKKLLDYFNPKFLLGMTATPERTDGLDIFKLFDHNIAYEIRLHRAMQENMLSPFHYYGVTDLTINDEIVDDKTDFNLLTAEERITRISEVAELYGTDDGLVKGLVFCSKVEECRSLSAGFNKRGFKTVALTGENSEEERAEAIADLECNNPEKKLDYIFTVDIFNEGIDIPSVNQIIMLRPTQSAIIFVQQLGRGLRKLDEKSYLTVIDFIGNYSNNYLVPIALYGDTTYNKDVLRKLMASGSRLIPGSSTVNFDRITKDRIFASIDFATTRRKDLQKDYELLRFKLGHSPKMIDFLNHGSRDPWMYVEYSKSFFNFAEREEKELKGKLTAEEKQLLVLFSEGVNNSKRVEESLILKILLAKGQVTYEELRAAIEELFKYKISTETFSSCINNLNFHYLKKEKRIVQLEEETITVDSDLSKSLANPIFKAYLKDSIEYSIRTFTKSFKRENYVEGFLLYRKYSKKDIFRILNWETNPNPLNVGGYQVSPDQKNCAIFVNYHKEEDISESTKYEDEFIDQTKFQWMSKNNRSIDSPEIKLILNYKSNNIRIPLFIRKSNDEGSEFYYTGELRPVEESLEQTSLLNDNGKKVSVVKMNYNINPPVDEEIYNYITSGTK